MLSKDKIDLIKNFDFENYLYSLYNYGYWKLKNNKNKYNDKLLLEFQEDGEIRKRLYVTPISKHLKDQEFIKRLFSDLLIKEEQHVLVNFLLLYQVIEILIGKISVSRINEFVEVVKVIGAENMDREDFSDFFDLNEKKRINLLFDKCGIKNKCPELKSLLEDFLGKDKEKHKGDLASLFYAVRNFVVHNYSKMTKHQEEKLFDINYYFERLIISILTNYN